MARAYEVRKFWLDELSQSDWYVENAQTDETIRDRFLPLWHEAASGGLAQWLIRAEDVLAFLILTDQFPRNMFRGAAEAFATDGRAREVAKRAIVRGLDQQIEEPQRQFFFMPLMHSESLTDQDHAVRLFLTRMPCTGADSLLHARAHREVIRMFGRFPYRNAALGRSSTTAETRFLENGGYGAILNGMRRSAA